MNFTPLVVNCCPLSEISTGTAPAVAAGDTQLSSSWLAEYVAFTACAPNRHTNTDPPRKLLPPIATLVPPEVGPRSKRKYDTVGSA